MKGTRRFGRPTGDSQGVSGRGSSLGGTLGSGAKLHFKSTMRLRVVCSRELTFRCHREKYSLRSTAAWETPAETNKNRLALVPGEQSNSTGLAPEDTRHAMSRLGISLRSITPRLSP